LTIPIPPPLRPRANSPSKDAPSRVSINARVLKQPSLCLRPCLLEQMNSCEEKMTTTRSRYSSLTTIVTALFSLGSLLITPLAVASILGSVRGLIHDPQHRPVSGALVNSRVVRAAVQRV